MVRITRSHPGVANHHPYIRIFLIVAIALRTLFVLPPKITTGSFYMSYLSKWPESFVVAESPHGSLMGYVIGKAEGEDNLWHGHVVSSILVAATCCYVTGYLAFSTRRVVPGSCRLCGMLCVSKELVG